MGRATSKKARPLPGPMMTAEELADHLGMARQTIYDWVYYRKVPFYRFGRKGAAVRFDAQEVTAWLLEKRVAPLTEV